MANIGKHDTRITIEGILVAEIHRDFSKKMKDIMLIAGVDTEQHLFALRSVLIYAHQYVRQLSEADIAELNYAELVTELGLLGITVSVAEHPNLASAVDAVIAAVNLPGLRYTLPETRQIFDDEKVISFHIQEPNRFTFWKNENRPTSPGSLNIIPDYHPAMNGQESVGLVNGDTDAYVSGTTIKSIYCPQESRAETEKAFSTSWAHVTHPFRATGAEVMIEVNTTNLRSAEGVVEVTKLLQAALGLSDEYVAISGGFRPPLHCAHNRLVQTGRANHSPYPGAHTGHSGHLARGSEAHCVWAYRTLEAEGTLDGSHVPEWFLPEGWLEIYADAEERVGIY